MLEFFTGIYVFKVDCFAFFKSDVTLDSAGVFSFCD